MSSSSPLNDLVLPWWRGARVRPSEVPRMRVLLADAMRAEMEVKALWQKGYNPFQDDRLLWAAAYLCKAEIPGYRIDQDLQARAAAIYNQTLVPCGKDLAAGN